MKISIWSVMPLSLKLIITLCALLICINSISIAQENKWPVSVYGGRGGNYAGAAKISGYIVLNSQSLKGLIHRTFMKESRFDTLVNSDTLRGRINLFIMNQFVDVELPNANVVSIPCFYITSIVGSSLPQVIESLTTWVMLSPNMYNPFGRLLAKKNDVFFYDNSQWDTSYKKYECPMILRNGHEEIKINSFFGSARTTLIKFIKKRYAVDFSNDRFIDERALIEYILTKENEMENEKTNWKIVVYY